MPIIYNSGKFLNNFLTHHDSPYEFTTRNASEGYRTADGKNLQWNNLAALFKGPMYRKPSGCYFSHPLPSLFFKWHTAERLDW